MRKFALALSLMIPVLSVAQTCHDANASFVAMAEDESFVNAHELPAVNDEDYRGGIIFFDTDGERARGYKVDAREETDKWILIFHEWWGMNPNIIRETQDLCEHLGVNVLAIDLYDGQIATTREEASALMQGANPERIQAIIDGAFDYIGESARVGTIGWCFGGGWSLQAALIGSNQVDACVMYYGMPESDVERLSTLNAPVLGIFANQDQWINPDVVADFESNMDSAGEELTVYSYDAQHAFANPSNEGVYNEEAARDAREKAYDFFRENLL
ncbi:MAG: dienelactone hydrolase family protein [Flavobacteriia bacterium]|nr:dienelactone hydrolase family protein [Flavobacteriia bacterium]